MEAVKNFDPYRGVRFPSYAVWWVKAYIVRYLIANWRLVKIGTTQAQRKLFFNLKKEQEKLEREGFFAEPKLLAERLNVKESEVLEMQQRLGGADMSVDAPLQSADSESNLLSILPAQQANVEDLLDKKKWSALFKAGIDEFLETASHKEKIVFKSRLLSEDKVTLHEVAEQLDLSKERVRQIENQLREKFKKFLEEKFGDEILQFLP
jgi:RNA polymerase sigma-32 factor